ncbi:[protein-PII] uridylyltransferase family protein [Cysteiniphilum halobium]|uniref:[protein-PII] uridylyltransferase family protein n=1 Tax=Cysteiniphilum halobium TaxID=2219059 RepID=UPI000E6509F2|nr:HD domain-containing protein [Cysteiniphilum halobium]
MLKQSCQQIMDEVATLFLKKKHSIYKILLIYSKRIDKLLIEYFPQQIAHISLIAIGGYGRQDRALYSDLDLLFLAENDKTLENTDLLAFIQQLQSLPIKVGYSTHNINSVLQHANHETNLLTALLDARFICGNKTLFDTFKSSVERKQNLPVSRDFIYIKYAEQVARDSNFPINQQPDLKNTVGNLRYLQSIHWLLIYLHPNVNLHYLVDHHYITKDELTSLSKAHRLLSAIRFYLHILYQREQNSLLIDKQLMIAEFFGFKHRKPHKSIELFMQHYYNSIRHVKLINRIIFHELMAAQVVSKNITLSEGFSIHGGILKHTQNNYPTHINNILIPFKYFCQHKEVKTLDAHIVRNTLQLLSQLAKKNLRVNQTLQQQFLAIFTYPYNIKGALSIMMDLGIVEKIIPEFAISKGQMQFDLYHQYTVDRHTIEVISNLRTMRTTRFEQEFPLAYHVMLKHPAQRLLYIAAFFHDIGKGSGVDHSKFGARLVQKYAEIWRLKQDEIHLLSWLVKHHLAFSGMIKKEDIYDGAVITQFAQFCQSQYYLDSLFLLTIADVKGTNPKLWTHWQQTMFEHLYTRTSKLLRKSEKLTLKEQVRDTQRKILAQLEYADQNMVKTLWQSLPARYFTEQALATLIWQNHILCQHVIDNNHTRSIYTHFDHRLNQTLLLILSTDKEIRLSSLCYLLYKASINITEASFFKLPSDKMLYQFSITNLNYHPLQNEQELLWLEQHLKTQLTHHKIDYTPAKSNAFVNDKSTTKRLKKSVQLLSPRHKNYSKVIVKYPDRPGLLAALCYFFEIHHLHIARARIHTSAFSVEDSFYITDSNDQPITKQSRRQLLAHKFLKYLKSLDE